MFTLGLNALAPRVAPNARWILALTLALTCLSAYLLMTQVRFSGNFTENLASSSPTYQRFQQLETDFHPFSKDESIIISATSLAEPGTYQQFQEFLLDLQFANQVQSAFSIFTLPATTPDQTTKQSDADGFAPRFFLLEPDQQALPVQQRLTNLRQANPLGQKMLSEDLSLTIVALIMQPQTNKFGEEVIKPLTAQNRAEILALAEPYKSNFKISFVGIPEIQRTIRDTIKQDQTRLTIAATIICLLIAWVTFRSWRVALICSLPPVISVLWYFGFLALFGIPVDFLTTMVPTMIIVVGFADSLHLYMAIQRGLARKEPIIQSIENAIKKTGPACLLTSTTTALAFIGIGIGGAETMQRLSVTGACGVMLAFLPVILILPSLTITLLGKNKPILIEPPRFLHLLARPAGYLTRYQRKPVLLTSFGLAALLLVIHFTMPSSFRVSDYLPQSAKVRQDEALITEKLGGSGQLFAILSDPDGKAGLSPSDLDIFSTAIETLEKATQSSLRKEELLSLLKDFDHKTFATQVAANDNPLIHRFISKDGKNFLIPLPLETISSSNSIRDYASRIEAALAEQKLDRHISLTGVSLMVAKETPRLIEDLRAGLISAVIIVIAAMMVMLRSIRMGLACLLPNLIPILTVEAFFWVTGEPVTLTAVIALTIAFGIAVDNSIHLLNQYHLAKTDPITAGQSDKKHQQAAIQRAIKTITPALTATTLLLVMGLTTTAFSQLPTITLFGQLVTTALLMALLSDLFLLPSFILTIGKSNKAPEKTGPKP